MKRYRIILFIIFSSIFFTGCEDAVLDKEPRQSISESDVWSDLELVQKYVWSSYDGLVDFGIHYVNNYSAPQTEGASDQVYGLHSSRFAEYVQGEISPDQAGYFGSRWAAEYINIRNVNIFFQNIDNVEGDESIKNRLKGEMKFLRAWSYHKLTSLFGGVPLITEPFELTDDFSVARSSFEDCVEYIISELDDAINMVPEDVPPAEWGRITKGAVLGLKSEVLLYAASILHDPGTQPSGPLFDYTKTTKWQDASDAAKAVIDLPQYALVEVGTWEEYQQMFLSKTPEMIFVRPHHPQHSNTLRNLDQLNSPNGYDGWSAINPTQQFVDQFQMKDGLYIDESPQYNPSPETIYENREMRFYADILYNGAIYRGRAVEFFRPGGLDSEDGPGGWNASATDYCQRKYMDESVAFTEVYPTTPNIFFRLAEFYLNYAEAQYHLGNESVARDNVNIIRNRVDLPDITSSGEELLKDIRHERNIEMCFEDHRFWDIRRWMIAEEVLNQNALGMEWKKDDNGQLSYDVINVQNRQFDPTRMYYIPIPRSEIEKTDLVQNPGYN